MCMLQTVIGDDSLKSRIRGQNLLAEMLQRCNIGVVRVPHVRYFALVDIPNFLKVGHFPLVMTNRRKCLT